MKSLSLFALVVVVGICNGQKIRDNIENGVNKAVFTRCLIRKLSDDLGDDKPTVDSATEFMKNFCVNRADFYQCAEDWMKTRDDEAEVIAVAKTKMTNFVDELCYESGEYANGVSFIMGARGCYQETASPDIYRTCVNNLGNSMDTKLDNYKANPNVLDELPACDKVDEALSCIETAVKGCSTESLNMLKSFFKTSWVCEDNGTIQ